MLSKILSILSVLRKEGAQNWHEAFILDLAKLLRPKNYVELGLYQCKLFNEIIPYAENLVGVDINPLAGKYMKKSSKTHFYWMGTAGYLNELKKSPFEIDMLFVDADHSEKSVREDFLWFFPYVKDQGIILLHDGFPKNTQYTSPWYCWDGYKAIAELSRHTQDYEMVTIPLHPGLTICRKRTNHAPHLQE